MEKQTKKKKPMTSSKSTARRNLKPVRIWPTEDNPRYGQRFKVIGCQFINIDKQYTEMLDMELGDWVKSPYDREMHFVPKLFEVGKTWGEWRRNKEKLSDLITDGLNRNKRESYKRMKEECMFPSMMGAEPLNYREVCALKIEYVGGDTVVV